MIIAVIGRAGTGKTAAARAICKQTNMPLVEISDVVRSITKGTKRQEMNLKLRQLEEKDPDWLWKKVRTAILGAGRGYERSCVVSGLREPYLLHKILEEDLLGDTLVLGLEATPFTRYSRLCTRDGWMSVEDFRKVDDGTLERDNFVGDNILGIDIVLTRCDKIFDTNGPIESLEVQVQKYLFDKMKSKVRSKI